MITDDRRSTTEHGTRPLHVTPETQRFLVLSIFIGLFTGLIVVCFHVAIDVAGWYAADLAAAYGSLGRILLPGLGAGLAAALVLYLFRPARGSGINYTKAALYVSDGYIPSSTVVGKFAACTVSLGSGNSLGPEDPALQMGAGVASALGRSFRLPRERLRLVAPVGAAAGLAAAFNTPITAVLFVIEEVIGAWNAAVLGSIVLSAVSAVVVSRSFLGDQPLFRVPAIATGHPSEFLVFAAVGAAAGLLAVANVAATWRARHRLSRAPAWSRPWLPVAAGAAVGLVGLAWPEVMGVGYGTVDSTLHDEYAWRALLVLGVAKVFVTSLCFSAGTPGGMFAPTLFSGAMIGGAASALAHQYWPTPVSGTGLYVLVGMGAFFAAVFRAPMTSMFMAFEVSASYVVILPVMIANTVAYLLSRHLEPMPFFERVARDEGLDLPSPEVLRETRSVRVEEAMGRLPRVVLRHDMLVAQARAGVAGTEGDRYLVSHADGTWSVLQRQAAEDVAPGADELQTLERVATLDRVPSVYPDASLDTALHHLARHELLPVVSRADATRLLGTLTLDDVLAVYGFRAEDDTRPGGPDSTADGGAHGGMQP